MGMSHRIMNRIDIGIMKMRQRVIHRIATRTGITRTDTTVNTTTVNTIRTDTTVNTIRAGTILVLMMGEMIN
jgi:hypothetical protein